MYYYFSKITLATIIFTVLGFLIAGSLIFLNLKPTNELPKDLILTDQNGVNVDTLRFYNRAQLLYDSVSVFIDEKKTIEKVEASRFFFHYNPDLLVWLTLITIMMAIAIGVLPSLIDRLFWLQDLFKISKTSITLILLMTMIIGLLFTVVLVLNPYLYTYIDWINQLKILFRGPFILQMVILIPTISGLIGLAGMIFISKSVGSLSLNQGLTDSLKEKIKQLNQSLKFFLTITTTLITLAVITTGALRKAILQEVVVSGFDMIPLEFVYLYGLQFTIVLAIFYLPIYYQLRSKSLDFIKIYKGKSDLNDKSIKGIEDFMQESVMDTLKIVLSILAPLLGGVLPDIINF